LSEADGKVVTVDDLVRDINEARYERESLDMERKPLTPTWEWGYYLLKSRKSEYEDLVSWLDLLLQAHAQQQLVKVISIGYIGDSKDPFVVKTWNGKTIFFLNDEVSPSLELAQTAVSTYSLL
jgi:hypothetical protein